MSFDVSKAMEWAYKDMLTFFPENVSTFGSELDQLFAMIYYSSHMLNPIVLYANEHRRLILCALPLLLDFRENDLHLLLW